MKPIDDLVALMQQRQKGIKFKDLVKVCDHYFGKPRQNGTSHIIYKTHGMAILESIFKKAAKRPKLIK